MPNKIGWFELYNADESAEFQEPVRELRAVPPNSRTGSWTFKPGLVAL